MIWLNENWQNILVAGIIVLAVVFIVIKLVKDKKRGGCSCCQDCSGCSNHCKKK